jgi:hypothetical protein
MSTLRGVAGLLLVAGLACAEAPLRIATFRADVTPPLGSPLCCDAGIKPATQIVDPLSARGVILFGSGKPIVLAVLDWVGIESEGWDEWRRELAQAAGTDMDRVTVNTIHVHDAPEYDPGADRVLEAYGLQGKLYNREFAREALARVTAAVREAAGKSQPVTHLGLGRAKVEKVASNRRILGPDGKVRVGRMSSCKDPAVRAEPEGTIDPYVRLVSFWNKKRPLVVISFYASHPQSHYGKGGVSADFPGMARSMREAELPGVFHMHFNGAGGNVAAGKYNDGSPEMRPILARRLADGMKTAWTATVKTPIRARDVGWTVLPVALPPSKAIPDNAKLREIMADTTLPQRPRLAAGHSVDWVRLCAAGRQIPLFRLSLGTARLLYMPGELFVEYQLAVQAMQPNRFVAMAAYGDYGPGYIGTRIAYFQGGYETGSASRTAPEVEDVLMGALRRLMQP